MSSEHKLTWDGPFGNPPMYWVNCSCGWSKSTFSASREDNIGTVMDEHRAAVGEA